MARAGRSTTIGRSTRTGKKKDFVGSGVEGEKTEAKAEETCPKNCSRLPTPSKR